MNRTIISAILAAGILLSIQDMGHAGSSSIAYTKKWLRNTPVHVVTVNLNDPDIVVSTAIARRGIGSSEGFGSMLSRLSPAAAITGTYFCLNSLVPVGDIVVDGRTVNTGSVGTGICFTPDNILEFKPAGGRRDWTGYQSVVCSGPNLVRNRIAYVTKRMEGFTSESLYRKASRTAVGITKANKMLLVSVNQPIYMGTLAKIMKDLGAVNAANLDGGTSTALYCKGRVLSHPGRKLTNLIVVYESQKKFAAVRHRLAPSPVASGGNPRS
ncbi:MAG: phosphodiester glycosidase family protein [Armatimonadota bacterium]|jgi:hypothetical protein|nr:hypothetical protein [Armatimonadota bacterium]